MTIPYMLLFLGTLRLLDAVRCTLFRFRRYNSPCVVYLPTLFPMRSLTPHTLPRTSRHSCLRC